MRGSSFRCEEITVSIDGARVLSGTSLECASGQVTGLMGANGSGKTTLLDVMTALRQPEGGKLFLGDTDVTGWSPSQLSGAGVRRTFQITRLFPSLSVIENLLVSFPEQTGERFTGLLRRSRVGSEEENLQREGLATLREFALEDVATNPASALSFGQQKVLSFLQITMSNPGVLLLDEPFAGVAEPATRALMARIRQLCEKGTAVLVVEHDPSVMAEIADWIVRLDGGAALQAGSPEDVLR